MPTPTGSTNSTDITLSGDSLIDSLVYGTKWGGSLGSGATLSYSFLSNNSYYAASYSFDNEYLNSYQLSSNQKTSVTQALDAWAAVANIDFSLTVDSSTNAGDLRFGGYAGMDSGTAAWAYLPGSGPVAGDVWVGPATSDANPTPGTYDYLTFVHEIGHALGLKHSFESDSSNPNVLPTEYEDVRYTVMSYSDAYSFEPTTPMLLDIAAIQYLYGANMQWQTGNNTYQWAADKPVFETIWDAGGTDTLNASNQTTAVALNLNPGTFSSIGQSFLKYETSGATSINNGLAIAYGARIENAVGSAYADTLIGNQWANVLNGGAGADQMIGGDGADFYYVDNSGDVVSEINATTSGGIDTVCSYLATYTLGANIENLRLLATGTANGTGNDLDNVIYAGDGNNILDGGAGIDTVDYTFAISAVTANLTTTALQATSGSGSDTLKNFENLTGSKYNDKLTGNSAANTLDGGAGNDKLNGAAGADQMIGGDGSDSYFVDDTGDIVSETNATASTGGTDTVYSFLTAYTLGVNVENLRLLATGTANGTGNDLDNVIYSGDGNNILDGGAGIDTVSYVFSAGAISVGLANTFAQASGGSGSDTLLNIENLTGSNYNDRLTGNSAANILDGGAGNDILNGSAGADRMIGGNGSDSYFVDNIGDIVSETNATPSTGGIDTVYSYLAAYTLGANVENLRLLATGTATGTGNSLDNRIHAGAGNNILDGDAGVDTVSYSIATSAVTVNLATTAAQTTGGSGSDTLLNIENLTGSKYNDKLTGNSAANTLDGGAGNDKLNGAAGADQMIGGDGSDSYFVDDTGDIVSETNATASTGGTDTVYSFLTAYTLGVNVENLRLLATGTANGTGNDLDNVIYAGDGNNILDGAAGIDTADYTFAASDISVSLASTAAQVTSGSGSDTLLNIENLTGSKYNDTLTGNSAANNLNGGTGNDTLTGGDGNDLLIGGLGTDTLYGGLDADRFDFNALSEMGLGALRDVIGDFNSSEGDQIDLSTLDADTSTTANDAFSFIGSDSFSNTNAAGQLRFLDGILYGSTNADANAEFEIQLLGVTSLNSTDLIT